MQAPLPLLTDDDQITFVHLSVNPTPAFPNPITFNGPPPANFTPSDLTSLNSLAQLMTSITSPLNFVPPVPQAVPNQRSIQINQYKDEGNNHFRKGDFRNAILLYSQAALISSTRPLFESQVYARDEIAIMLCNRCAAYMAIGEWVNALVDAEAVIALKKPWVKGYFRKGKALMGLERWDEAREALLLGLQFDPAAEDLRAEVAEVEVHISSRASRKLLQ